MNLLHMKYAVEVARQGTLSRAAEILHTAQPNISRAMKELESDIGITIFIRTKRGMTLTPEGEEFIGYAREVLSRLDEMEGFYKQGIHPKHRFALIAPSAFYITEAMASLATHLGGEAFDIAGRDLPIRDTIRAVEIGEAGLGILRYPVDQDAEIKAILEEKGLVCELVAEFVPVVLMHAMHPLASASPASLSSLTPFVEVVDNGAYKPTARVECSERSDASVGKDEPTRRIHLSERAASLEVLGRHPEAYLWSDPCAEDVMARYGLIALRPIDLNQAYKDLLIYREGHALTREERLFITDLCQARRRHMPK